ncbi:MAG: hypothetical protein JXQ99_24625 [Hyphomicrobiaceae bacterium]
MKTAPFLAAGALSAILVVVAGTAAEAKVRVVPYAKAGNWNVRAVYLSSGSFDHCSANAKYQSGTRVSIIVYRSGNWRLWFAHSKWPDRGRATFPATVQVDNRVVLNRSGRYKGRNAYIDLGREISRVKALMRGRSMAIVTPSGTSRFSLRGTNRATRSLAGCWKAHYKRPAAPATGGAFGSANKNSGAFGGGTVARRKANELSRANTLEIATRYLSKAAQPYSIFPRDKAPLKHFPVNWKLESGLIGGMRVFKNTSVGVDKLLSSLLSDQAKHCKGRNASQREPQTQIRGRNIAKARGVCETSNGNVLNINYKVAQLGRRMVMMIMEIKSVKGRRPIGGLNSRRSAPSTPTPLPGRQPGPNEL